MVAMPPWEKRKSLLLRRMAAARGPLNFNFRKPDSRKGPFVKRRSLLLRRMALPVELIAFDPKS